MLKRFCIIICLVGLSSFGQNKNCEDFRTGEFIYPDNPNKVSLRKTSVQESYNNGKLEMLWKITWINDCSYEMVCEKLFNTNLPIQIGDRIVATIYETDSKCCKFSYVVYNSNYPNGFEVPTGIMCKK